MPLRKLTSTEAFVVTDFDDVPSVGLARFASKVLQRGAWEMARSSTYQAALCGLQLSGASAGLNGGANTKAEAVAAFAGELEDSFTSGQLFLTPAKGLDGAPGQHLTALDQRPAPVVEGFADIRAAGVIAAADAASGGLNGKTVAIEGFAAHGPALARGVEARGGRVAAISTTGFVSVADSMTADGLATAWAEHGPAMIDQVGQGEAQAGHMVFGALCDVLLIGSKMGALSHQGTDFVKADTVVAHSEVPYTTKAVVNLQRAGKVVVPDVVSLAAPLVAAFGTGDPASAVGELTASLKDHPEGLTMGAFLQAEEFMRTWRDALPFGRPFAA